MQKELQNGQKQKCKIYKLTKCSSSEDPTKGQSDLISHLSREIASGVRSTTLQKGEETRNLVRRSIFSTSMNYKSIRLLGQPLHS